MVSLSFVFRSEEFDRGTGLLGAGCSAGGSGINEKNHSLGEMEAGLTLEKDAMNYF